MFKIVISFTIFKGEADKQHLLSVVSGLHLKAFTILDMQLNKGSFVQG